MACGTPFTVFDLRISFSYDVTVSTPFSKILEEKEETKENWHCLIDLKPKVNDFNTYFLVTTFLPLTKLVDVLMRLTFPPPPPCEPLKVDRDVKPPFIEFNPPKACGENMSSINEKLKNGDITFCGCDERCCGCLLPPAWPFGCRRFWCPLKISSKGLPPKNSRKTSSGSRKTNGNPKINSLSNGSGCLRRWWLL